MYFVYILYSQTIDKYYVGQTYSISARLEKHRFKTTRFTKRAEDWELVYYEVLTSRSEAVKRERQIKKNEE